MARETLSLPGKISLLTRVWQNFAMLVGLKVKKVALKSAGGSARVGTRFATPHWSTDRFLRFFCV
nr:hypothetical protein K4M19_00166 [Agrobacterium fabrum]